jgi:predicted DsbA family dithiol-disulfide isomerase
MNIDLYTDISCPWCYIASHRWRRVLADLDPAGQITFKHKPFQLNPDMPSTPIPLLDYYRQRGGEAFVAEHLKAQEYARDEGLAIDMSRALAANTIDAHRLLWIVRREAGDIIANQVHDELVLAYFAEGLNIADHGTLAGIAARQGVDAGAVRAALTAGDGRDQVRAEIGRGHALGIRAVPSAIIDGISLVQGAVPASRLERIVRGAPA